MLKNGCVFCDEIVKRGRAAMVYEDNDTMAFMDIVPVNRGHTLVIPKDHFVNIFDIDSRRFAKVHELSRVLAKAVMEAVDADAINIGQNNGPCANQVVMHYHLHIIPRWCNHNLNWDRKKANGDELEEVASLIRETFSHYRNELQFQE